MLNNCHSYVNSKLTLRESSISGIGYVAEEAITKDEVLIVQSGQCVHVDNIDSLEYEPFWYYGFQIETEVYLYPLVINSTPCLDGIFRINHSCNPTAGFKGQITLVALKDLEAGDEITYDYAMTDVETDQEDTWTPQACACGELLCRNVITGDDWRNPTLQERYEGYFSTHVKRAINALQSET